MLEINKIYNEDCLVSMQNITDKSIDMILCDLPYGTTQCKWDSIIPLDKLWIEYNRIIKDNGVIALFGDEPFTSMLIASNLEKFKYRITWNKMAGSNFLNAKKMPLKQTEDICIFTQTKLGNNTYNPIMKPKDKKNVRDRENENRKAKDVTTYGKNNGKLSNDYNKNLSYPTNLLSINAKMGECNSVNRVHPTQKPVELLEWLVETYSNENDIILDNCIGSGSTALACINTNRNYIGFELDNKYYNLANERINKLKMLI